MCKLFKTFIALSTGIVLSMALPAAGQQAIRFGTSSVGSSIYVLAVGASEVIQKHAGINITVEAVGGSGANVRGLAAGNIEFALANSFAAVNGYKGIVNFKKPVDIQLVAQGHPSLRWLFLRKSAAIKRVEDLAGRTVVAKRPALPDVHMIMGVMLKQFKVNPSSVNQVATTQTGAALKALAAGSVDAALLPFGRGAANIQKPMKDGIIDFLYLPAAQRDEMLKQLPSVMWGQTLPKGTFMNQSEDVNVIAMNTYLLTRPGVSEETVYKVVKAVLENTKELMSYQRLGRYYNLDNTLRHVSLPFHPGAIRYFKEKGVWTSTLEANQQALVKR